MEAARLPPPPPCGLTRQEVLALRPDVPLVGGLCQNLFRNTDGQFAPCGCPIGEHPSETAPAASVPVAVHANVGNILYTPGALNPEVDNWIKVDITPIPMGSFVTMSADVDSTAVDPRIVHNLCVFLDGTTGGGEEAQIFRNDGLFRSILIIAGVNGVLRNKKTDSTPGRRADFSGLYNGVPVLHVEEKVDDDISSAVDDVVNKFFWLPQLRRLPFFIGIAVSFSQIKFVKLTRDRPAETIFSASLNTLLDRLSVLKPAVNVARVLKYFIDNDMIHSIGGLSIGPWHVRQCGKSIRLSSQGVEVRCPDATTFRFLKKFYNACRNVPFLEKLSDAVNRKLTLHIGPLGLSRMPNSVDEFKRVIVCISTAIFGLYRCGYVHTDIRWPNIVELDEDWILIDCYEVCELSDSNQLKRRAVSRGRSDGRAWGLSDDLKQLAKLSDHLPFVPGPFKRKISLALSSSGATLPKIITACSAPT